MIMMLNEDNSSRLWPAGGYDNLFYNQGLHICMHSYTNSDVTSDHDYNLFFLWEMLRCRGERARACMTGPILTAPRVSLTAWPYRPRGDGLLLLLVSSCVCKYEYISGVVVTHMIPIRVYIPTIVYS